MEEEAAWVPEAVWTLQKIEKSLDDAMNRKTIPFCAIRNVVTVPGMSCRTQKIAYFTSIWYKNIFPDRNFEENKSFVKGP
jgi:hypothetical protein